eukprot:m.4504 g.4504  ORF g.4504 m.4504 type:complete len:88 (-) comp6994_c0_seq2:84-347(-)
MAVQNTIASLSKRVDAMVAKADQRSQLIVNIKQEADQLQADFDAQVQLTLARGGNSNEGSRPTTPTQPSSVTMQQAMLSPTMNFTAV